MFSIPCVLSLWFLWLWLLLGILWDDDEACVPETIYDIKWILLQCFEKFNNYFFDKWIVIHFLWDVLRMRYSVMWLTLIYLKKFLSREDGVLHYKPAFVLQLIDNVKLLSFWWLKAKIPNIAIGYHRWGLSPLLRIRRG